MTRRERERFRREILAGLSLPQKEIPCKFLYDERGSQLFEQICDLEEYYLTRTELSIMREHVGDMAKRLGPACCLIEYGSGTSTKTRLLLDALEDPAGYVPIDISEAPLEQATQGLRAHYPELEVRPLRADYTQELQIPELAQQPERRVVYFPGSTIGNFEPAPAEGFLKRMGKVCGRHGGVLIGVDLEKDEEILENAYDDAQGVTAEFNLNLLRRVNRELDADFDLESFRHEARFNGVHGRVEMHLVSERDQDVSVGGARIRFEAEETIWTESSYKHSLQGFAELADGAGLVVEEVWTDPSDLFSVQYLRVG